MMQTQIVLLLTCTTVVLAVYENPVVTLKTGQIEGLPGISRDGRNFSQFLGIPYGKIPKRFAISQPADEWKGTKETKSSGPGCIQYPIFGGDVIGQENCLTLDIYTSSLNSSSLLPVLVYIHGGGFITGSSSKFGGDYFMDEDVVLVIINYRLGPIGFLNTGVATAAGNQGLKDQILALHFVQENIHHFGGNKESVTIFGGSSGSVSVGLLLISPLGVGLFHRAIMSSGTPLHPAYQNGADGLSLAKRLGVELDCPTSNPQYLVECLERIDPKILGSFGKFVDEFGYDENGILFGPSYETYADPDGNGILSGDPYVMGETVKFAKIPVILGLMHTESGWGSANLANASTLARLNAQWCRRLPSMLFMGKTAEDPACVCDAVKKHFFNGTELTVDSTPELRHLLDERHWINPLRLLSKQLVKNGAQVYLYNFTKPISLPAPFGNGQPKKASHGDEVRFLFGKRPSSAPFHAKIGQDSPDYQLSRGLVRLWAGFAKDGKPSKLWGSETEWTPAFVEGQDVEEQLPTFLYIDDTPKVEKVGEWWRENEKFWAGLSFKENGKKWASEV